MELKLIEKSKEKASFLIKGIDAAFVNTVRRMIISEVPTMAIDEVEFLKNSSVLYDEMIAHRLGLVVLKTDVKSYNLVDKCKCKGKGCAQCQLYLSLDKSGPCVVYAQDLKSKDPKVKAVHPMTSITKLIKGQELKLNALAVLGRGKEHAKFSPGLVYYQAYPDINILKPNSCSEAVKVCPRNVFRLANRQLKVVDLTACILCMACVSACGEDAIEVKGSEKDFIVSVEPWGQLKTDEIIESAVDQFDEKLDDLAGSMKSI